MIKNTPVAFRRLSLPLAVGLAALTLTACTVTPRALSVDDQIKQASADQQQMFAQQEPVSGPISLDEAMARAVKYNLRHRLALMEQALAANEFDVKSFSMLPKLAASAGWNGRSQINASSSESVLTHSQSLEPSTSQDRSIRDAGLELSWNVLDFGLSYYAAKAQANNALAFEEKRRRIVADIIQKVRKAYWEAATAQRLQPQVSAALKEARGALAQARETEKQRLLSPLQSLRYQKALLKMVRQLEAVDAELATSRAQLAALMNLAPSSDYRLVVPDESTLKTPALNYPLAQLEQLAMIKRPEIREEAYKARNAVLETQSAMIKLLPGASLFAGSNYNSNSYLVNNDWADAGLKVSWNLFNLLSYPAIKRTGEARERVAELRRQALRMTVLTQVNVAWLSFQQAEHRFNRNQQLTDVQNRILKQTNNAVASQSQTVLERIRTTTEAVLTTRQRDRSYADLRTAYGAIYQAAGLDPLPPSLTDDSVAALSHAIHQKSAQLNAGAAVLAGIPAMTASPAAAPQVPQAQLALWNSLGSLQSVPVTRVEDK